MTPHLCHYKQFVERLAEVMTDGQWSRSPTSSASGEHQINEWIEQNRVWVLSVRTTVSPRAQPDAMHRYVIIRYDVTYMPADDWLKMLSDSIKSAVIGSLPTAILEKTLAMLNPATEPTAQPAAPVRLTDPFENIDG